MSLESVKTLLHRRRSVSPVMLGIGDSLTSNAPSFDAEIGFNMQTGEAFGGWTYVNNGENGANIDAYLQTTLPLAVTHNIDTTVAQAPAAILFMYLRNNDRFGESELSMYGKLCQVLDYYDAHIPNTPVIMMPPPPMLSRDDLQRGFVSDLSKTQAWSENSYNAYMRVRGDERHNVDVWDTWADIAGFSSLPASDVMLDILHYNSAGQVLRAQGLAARYGLITPFSQPAADRARFAAAAPPPPVGTYYRRWVEDPRYFTLVASGRVGPGFDMYGQPNGWLDVQMPLAQAQLVHAGDWVENNVHQPWQIAGNPQFSASTPTQTRIFAMGAFPNPIAGMKGDGTVRFWRAK